MMQPQVALSRDFLDAYSRLPKGIQKKVREFTEKFQQDPTSSGINFERLDKVRDPKVRSVRVDQAYRALVVHPPRGDVYLCVWVDHHDEAYRWVQNKVFEVNPQSGSLQLYDVTTTVPPSPTPSRDKKQPGLLDRFDDEELLLGGVPQPLLATVRALTTEVELDALAPLLPAEVADLLYHLASGSTLLEAIADMERSRPEPAKVDVKDFRQALAKPESQQSFKIINNERELEAMLDAPLAQWRVFLHPTQRKLVRMDASGPVRVLGGAGTGKTVVLMHRACHLAGEVFTADDDRLLVTTYTRNLALDLEANLKNLCVDGMERIEVANLHRWAANFMKAEGHSFIPIQRKQQRQFMEQAINETEGGDDYPLAFFLEEWQQVVQPQEVRDRDGYLTARRTGRGTRLGRRQRIGVWRVLERYRQLLAGEGLGEWQDLIRETRLYIEKQNIRLPYRAVLTDEVQDFTACDLRLLRTIAPDGPNTLFVVGDGHQRIYGRPERLSSHGIDIRGRSRRLKLNYRTTQEIRAHAQAILEGRDIDDLDGGVDSLKGYRSIRRGPRPELCHFTREADEAACILERLKTWIETDGVAPEAICLAARSTNLLVDRYKPMLDNAGFKTLRVKAGSAIETARRGVRVSTMHRMKGLEFKRVILAGVQEGVMPLMRSNLPDEASRQDHEMLERCLLYVASTRARDALFVTGFGKPSPFLATSQGT